MHSSPVTNKVIDSRADTQPPAEVLQVPLILHAPTVASASQPLAVGLPFPRSALAWPAATKLVDADGLAVPVQAEPLARWSDGSVRWLLLDLIAQNLRAGSNNWTLTVDQGEHRPTDGPQCSVRQTGESIHIDTGTASFCWASAGDVLPQVIIGGRPVLASGDAGIVLTDAKGRVHRPTVERRTVEAVGPVRASVFIAGLFAGAAPCRFTARLDAYAGTGLFRVRFTLHNPRRARHRGGLWDLGDRGSILFKDLSLRCALAETAGVHTSWRAEAGGPSGEGEVGPVEIYQDSSGGENWNSRNHVNRDGRVPCSFRGYRVLVGDRVRTGLRAEPIVGLRGPLAAVAAVVPEFWQQFPKAIEADSDKLQVRLFPTQFGDLHELQGGEKKTHTVWLRFGPPEAGIDELGWVYQPAIVRATPEWYCQSGAFRHLTPADPNQPAELDRYLTAAVEGDKSFVAGREVIDEYGWRNFGEIYADHESAYYDGPKPVISHYNNQYDVVHGAILQYCRTGDPRWWQIAEPLARHVADIDIYHTTEDKAAYNGGLFWFTDHYNDAATSSHRTYSKANRQPGRPYGGGPGSSHNFATGLAEHYYMTGDSNSREAALSLADWVIAMDDGARTIFGWIDDGPTGLASCTFDPDYHGPGRGPGLSINALLDGWQLTGRRHYLEKSEELIRRVVHPSDNIATRDLLNIELRWSYTIFFAALERYLAIKTEAGELDQIHAYARASLLHYAEWMVEHERPYLDRRDELEFPTETWAAQEFRKANVMRLAAAYADEPLRGQLLSRGRELADRAWRDLLAFETRHAARAVAIVLSEGTRDEWFRCCEPAIAPRTTECERFDKTAAFVAQKQRVCALLRSPVKLAWVSHWPDAWRRALRSTRDS
jgi:hypothetical protein